MRNILCRSAIAVPVLLLALAGPAAADSTAVVTSPIKAGSNAVTIGQASFTRTRADNGVTTIVVRGTVPQGMSESHLCYSTEEYRSRVSPGNCQLANETSGGVHEYTVTLPASYAERTVYFQFHVVSKGDTAFAGWQAGDPFYGNVASAAPEAGTPLPVGSLGGFGLAAAAGAALWAASRRRRGAGHFTHL